MWSSSPRRWARGELEPPPKSDPVALRLEPVNEDAAVEETGVDVEWVADAEDAKAAVVNSHAGPPDMST
jgi:hypothetical protein